MLNFPKREHIVSTRLIEQLFGSGSTSMAAYPLRAVFHLVERSQANVPAQILISVPKKRFKHAVDRNRVKRQVREAYRRCRQPLVDSIPADKTLLVGFIWIGDRLAPSPIVASRIGKLVTRIVERL